MKLNIHIDYLMHWRVTLVTEKSTRLFFRYIYKELTENSATCATDLPLRLESQ